MVWLYLLFASRQTGLASLDERTGNASGRLKYSGLHADKKSAVRFRARPPNKTALRRFIAPRRDKRRD